VRQHVRHPLQLRHARADRGRDVRVRLRWPRFLVVRVCYYMESRVWVYFVQNAKSKAALAPRAPSPLSQHSRTDRGENTTNFFWKLEVAFWVLRWVLLGTTGTHLMRSWANGQVRDVPTSDVGLYICLIS
jgi:hypothetical protein